MNEFNANPNTESTHTTETSVTPTPAPEPSQPSTPSPVTLNDSDLIPLKVGGKDITVPWSEARNGFQMHADYTRKMQELAEQRRQFEAQQSTISQQRQEYEAKLQQIQQVVNNPQALMGLYMNLQSKMQQPQGPQPLTTEALPQLMQAMEQRFTQQFQGWQQQQEKAQMAARFETELDTATKGALSKYPALAALDGIDEAIAGKVYAMKPTSLAEAKQYTQVVVDAMAQRHRAALDEEAKANLVAQQQARIGIEPKGGAPVLPQPRSFKNNGEREMAMLEFLNSLGDSPFGR